MKKIPWFIRIFWSWNKFEEYFSSNKNYSVLNEELIKSNNDLRKDKEELKIRISHLEKEVNDMKVRFDEGNKNIHDKNEQISQLKSTVSEIKAQLEEKTNNNKMLQRDINVNLQTLSKIEKTFFASTGNKGKGELGERQVKTILERSGLPTEFWTENLPVGEKNVEFAIKSANEGKWIPIDSKVLETELDENNKIIVDNAYKNKVRSQAKEISKYLDKNNTASYGVLVLQNDTLLMALYDEFPQLLQETLRDYKVYIASPASFVQMAWSISQILDIYEKVKGDEKIYLEMMGTLDSIANFANKLGSVKTDFDIAVEKHLPTIANKHKKLSRMLDKTGKLKEINNKGE